MRPEYKPLADILFASGAIKFGYFKLKLHDKDPTAPLSPIYIDLRGIVRNPRKCSLVTTALHSILAELTCDLIADIPQSISPAVANLMNMSGLPMITPRLEEKDRGTKSVILGDFKPGQIVVIVDDLTTKATSAIEIIRLFKEWGLQIKDILMLIDRGQGGAQQLAKEGCELHSVFQLPNLLEYYLKNGNINDTIYHYLVDYLKNN